MLRKLTLALTFILGQLAVVNISHADEQEFSIAYFYLKDGGETKLDEFRTKAKPLWKKYGLEIEASYKPNGEKYSVLGINNMTVPDEVQIYYFKDPAKLQAYVNDPEYKKIAGLRAEAVERMVIFSGKGELSKVPSKNKDRIFSIGMVYPEAEKQAMYEKYFNVAVPVLKNHSMKFDAVLDVKNVFGLLGDNPLVQPYRMLIYSFDSDNKAKGISTDPLYQAAYKSFLKPSLKEALVMDSKRS